MVEGNIRVVWHQSKCQDPEKGGYMCVAPCDVCGEPTGETQYEGPSNMSIRQIATSSDCGERGGRQRVGRILWCRKCDRDVFPNCMIGSQVASTGWDPKRCTCVLTPRGGLVQRDCAECRPQK